MDRRRPPLTVACVYVRGPFRYTADYVVRLARMVRRHTPCAFHFLCLVDADTEPEVRAAMAGERTAVTLHRVPSLRGIVPDNGVGYWQKVRLFDPALGLIGRRVLFLDLDTWIVAPLAPIIDAPAALALTTDALVAERAHLMQDRDGRQLVRRFNSSVMVWTGGTGASLWTDWTPAAAARLSTDQDWIGERAPHALGLPLEWFPRIGQLLRDPAFAAFGAPLPPAAKVVLVKKPKNAQVAATAPWFARAWGSDAAHPD